MCYASIESVITPEIFASHLCDDLRLPRNPFYKEIVGQVTAQIKDSATAVDYSAYLGDRLAEIREENRQWFETRSKRLKLDTGEEIALSEQAMLSPREIDGIMDEDEIKIMQPDQPSMSSASSQELRISIKVHGHFRRNPLSKPSAHFSLSCLTQLDITLNSIQLLDRFEWDISDQRNSPEVFAAVFAADLGLGGEFRSVDFLHNKRVESQLIRDVNHLIGRQSLIPFENKSTLSSNHSSFSITSADYPSLTRSYARNSSRRCAGLCVPNREISRRLSIFSTRTNWTETIRSEKGKYVGSDVRPRGEELLYPIVNP